MRRFVAPALLLVAMVGLWELVPRLTHTPDYVFATPSAVASSLWSERGRLDGATLVTLREIVLGYLLAALVGLAFGVLLHFSTALRRAFMPILVISQTIPAVALAPVLVILFGFGLWAKLVLIAIVCFFPIVVNTVDGLRATDPELVRMMRTLHGGRLAIFRRVEFPGALPSIFSGARIAATYAAVGAVFAEWAGSSDGLGFVMQQTGSQLDTSLNFAAIVILSGAALALYGLVTLAERILVPWTREVSHA